MNSKAKGNGFETEVKKILLAQGWSVFRIHRKPIFINGKMLTMGADIFGCDIVAKKPNTPTKWIQVSTVENKSKKEAQVLVHPWALDHEQVELWLRIKGKKAFRVFKMVTIPEKGLTFLETDTEIGVKDDARS